MPRLFQEHVQLGLEDALPAADEGTPEDPQALLAPFLAAKGGGPGRAGLLVMPTRDSTSETR